MRRGLCANEEGAMCKIANAGVPLANLTRFDGIPSWARLTDIVGRKDMGKVQVMI